MTDSGREVVDGSGENRRVIAILAIHLLGENIGTGGDRVLVEFAKRWRRSGREVVVIAPATAPASLRSQTGSPTRFVKSTPFDGRPGLFAIPFAYLFRAIRGIPIVAGVGADAIYSGGDFICNVLPGVWAKSRSPARRRRYSYSGSGAGVRATHSSPIPPTLAVSVHHINANPFTRHGNSRIASMVSYVLQRLSFRLIKRHADIIFVLNGAVKLQLVDLGFDPARIVITGAGVDLGRIDRAEVPAEPQFDACFAGRLNPTKGIFDLAPTWRKVVDELPDAKLLVMGGSEEWRGALKSEIAGQGLEGHITVAGFVPDEDYYSSIKRCRVFIAPSYEEGFNISLCEAMACGLPAVAYSLPVYRELFGEGPTLAPTGDTDTMAREIVNLLTDQRHYCERAAAATKAGRRYDWELVASTALAAIDSKTVQPVRAGLGE